MINEISIGGLIHEIVFEKNLTRDSNALGSHCGNNATIRIDDNLKLCVKQKTLLHEILEAINFEYSLKLEHNKICVLETALFDVIKNNKDLLKYLSD